MMEHKHFITKYNILVDVYSKIFHFIHLYCHYVFFFFPLSFFILNDRTDVCEKHTIHLYLYAEHQDPFEMLCSR